MNLKINFNYIYISIFSLFFFFWGVDLYEIKFFSFLKNDYLNSFRLSYLILLLFIPIFYDLKKNIFSIKKLFNYQQYIIFFIIFIVLHFFFVRTFYGEIIDPSEIASLFYLIFLSIIYCHYRNFIQDNFKKILTFYLIIFVLYSVFETKIYNHGQCNSDLFIIDIIQKYLKIYLTNSIYIENSHLAIMSIAVFFSSLFILLNDKKKNILFLVLFLIEIIIVLNNLSTTYFVCYFLVQIILLFLLKKTNRKFWVITILFLFINSYLFLSDKNCTVKVTSFSGKNIIKQNIGRDVNLTTSIYERSFIVVIDTFKNYQFGWGIEGMDNATNKLMNRPKYLIKIKDKKNEYNHIYFQSRLLNLKDGLSNSLKMFTEFGFFTFIIFYFFLRYILNIKNIKSYNIFIIALFITMCVRSAGYYNGGFIFCLLEFFYLKKNIDQLKSVNQNN